MTLRRLFHPSRTARQVARPIGSLSIVLGLLFGSIIGACAYHGLNQGARPVAPPQQTIAVNLPMAPAESTFRWTCVAGNDLGRWPFSAPGQVAVLVSAVPLRIDCLATPAQGASAWATLHSQDARQQGAGQGAKSGAFWGAGAGVLLGVAAAPVMGPVAVPVFMLGGAGRGAEFGAIIGGVSSPAGLSYPASVTLQVVIAP